MAKAAQKEVVDAILKVGVDEGVRVARKHISDLMSQNVLLKQLVIMEADYKIYRRL